MTPRMFTTMIFTTLENIANSKIDHAEPRIVRTKVCLYVTEEIPITISRGLQTRKLGQTSITIVPNS